MFGLSLGNKTAEFFSSVLLKCNAVSRQKYQVIKPVTVRTLAVEHVQQMMIVSNIYARGNSGLCAHLEGVYGEQMYVYIHTF
jgi:hypothetical protein